MLRQSLRTAILFLGLSALFFLVLRDSPAFPDPDSFYHAKMAVLIRDQGIVREFPWLQATVLKETYVDHHFLYHVLLIPFVSVFDPLKGIKIATALFAAGALTMLYAILRTLRVRMAGAWLFLALSSANFVYRLNLAKAPGISVFFLLLGVWLIIKITHARTKHQSIILHSSFLILNFLYVWLYSAWPFLLTLCVLMVCVARLAQGTWNWRLLLACATGIAAGLLFNPYFPDNLRFALWQIVEIGLKNYHAALNVGTEWHPFSPRALVAVNFAPLIATLFDFALFAVVWKRVGISNMRHRKNSTFVIWATVAIMTILLTIATLKARRMIEYLVPFQVIAAALGIPMWLGMLGFSRTSWRELIPRTWSWFTIFIASAWVALALVLVTVTRNWVFMVARLRSGFESSSFAPPATWLRAHTPAGSVVFLSDWGQFPVYFYFNDHNYYLDGLDPTFTYLKDPRINATILRLRSGAANERAPELLRALQVSYAVVPIAHPLSHRLAKDPRLEVVYEYGQDRIYALTNL